jgi:hypothetical protein
MNKSLFILVILWATTGLLFAQELQKPVAGKAKVYLFNYFGVVTGRNPVDIFVGKKYYGKLSSSSYYGLDLEPGDHLIWAENAGKKWFMQASLAAGKTYYIHLQPTAPKANFNPVPSPVLYNACPNDKKGKKRYADIEKRLKKNAFAATSGNTSEMIAAAQTKMNPGIEKVLAQWESDWKGDKKWGVIKPGDGF